MNNTEPFVVGFCGEAGTGKTSSAEILSPRASVQNDESGLTFDHFVLATPLYALHTAKYMIRGKKIVDRQLYEIHSILLDIFGNHPLYGAPPYDDLVTLTKEIQQKKIPLDTDDKPRAFLQETGDMLRAVDDNCFAKSTTRKIQQKNLTRSFGLDDDPFEWVVIVSDIRRRDEAEYLMNAFDQSMLIRLNASEEVRRARKEAIGEPFLTAEQAAHPSENVDEIPNELIDQAIETDDLTLKEQCSEISSSIGKKFDINTPKILKEQNA